MTPSGEAARLLVVAGEASGDLHAARLFAALRRRVPGLAAFGLGGDELRAAGVETLADSAELAVVGITEALRVLPRARRVFADLLAEVDRRRPAAALLVDFAEFNLRLAGALKRRGVEVIYYISPQVWAWRRGRVEEIARCVDRMLVIFPFEVDFYRRHGVGVTWVGHPLVDEVPELPQVWDRGGVAGAAAAGAPAAATAVESPARAEPFQIALLPGSRRSEVEALLPTMLEATRRVAAELPVFARLIRAPGIPAEVLEEPIARSGLAVEVSDRDRFRALADSHLALCASGTATLETGLLGTPMLVLYRLRFWTYLVARAMVRLPHVSLVNLVLGGEVVPELMQGRARPETIAREAVALLTDPGRIAGMRAALGGLRGKLGERGASARAAAEVAARLVPAAVGAPSAAGR
jgi:lipid-A-disaccharide synthase